MKRVCCSLLVTLTSCAPAASDEALAETSSSLTALTIPLATGLDDAEEAATGEVSTSSSDLELVYDGTVQMVGLRFAAVSVPNGARVTSAYVQFSVDQTDTAPVTVSIEGQASDSAPAFSTAKFDLSARRRTSTKVSWDIAPWPVVGARGVEQRTPNLSPVLNELFARPGWRAGNSVALIIRGTQTARRVAESFSGPSQGRGRPVLVLELGDTTPPAAVGDLSSSAITSTSVTLGWTAPGDDGLTGLATAYDVRSSTTTLSATTFAAAQRVSSGAPSSPGTRERLTVSGLRPATKYTFALLTRDEADNASALSNVVTVVTAPAQSGQPWPRLGAYLQGTTGFPDLEEAKRRAFNEHVVVTSPLVANAADFNTHLRAIKAANPRTKIYPYTNTSEFVAARPTWGARRAIWDKLEEMNWWARQPFPAGPVDSLWPGNNQCNVALGRKDPSSGLYWTEYLVQQTLDASGLDSSLVDGVYADNLQNTAFSAFDFDENGSVDGKRDDAVRAGLIASHRRKRAYVNGRRAGFHLFANAGSWSLNFFGKGIDDRAQMEDLVDGAVLELFIGIWNSPEGVFFYRSGTGVDTPPSLSSFRSFPDGRTFTSPPPDGTLCRNVFGSGWSENSAQPQNSLKARLDFYQLGKEVTDKSKIILQTMGAGMAPRAAYPQAWQNARYALMAAQVYTDFSFQIVDTFATPSSRGRMVVLDEYLTGRGDWGVALDPPGATAGPFQKGVFRRRFLNSQTGVQYWAFFNPIDNGEQTVTLSDVPAGFRVRRLRAADFENQDPVTNDGRTLSTLSVTLRDRDGLLLVVEPLP